MITILPYRSSVLRVQARVNLTGREDTEPEERKGPRGQSKGPTGPIWVLEECDWSKGLKSTFCMENVVQLGVSSDFLVFLEGLK